MLKAKVHHVEHDETNASGDREDRAHDIHEVDLGLVCRVLMMDHKVPHDNTDKSGNKDHGRLVGVVLLDAMPNRDDRYDNCDSQKYDVREWTGHEPQARIRQKPESHSGQQAMHRAYRACNGPNPVHAEMSHHSYYTLGGCRVGQWIQQDPKLRTAQNR